MKLYDKNAVAKFLDMTPKNVERLTQKGILQTKQGNLYALAETNRAYIKYLRDRNPESQEAVDLNEERAKLTKTKRLNEELDLAVKKGELHRSEDIEKVMTAMLINFKSRLSAIPAEEADKLAAMTDKAKIFLYLNDKIKVFIEKESASDDVPFGESIPEEMQVDQEDENSIELAPGAVIDLGEGEKANMVNPGRPNPNFDPFVIAVLKQIGAALEIPYEILIMAFSSNYSASRAAILEFFKVVKMYRAWFVADFCQPIYEEWLSEAVAKGRIKAPGFFTDPIIKDAYCSAEWTGPSAGQLDPTKEVEAAEKRVQGGYSTREREARELTGTDFYKNIKQRKREEELLKEVTGGAKTDTQTVENINGREESDTENNPDNDGGQTEEETEE